MSGDTDRLSEPLETPNRKNAGKLELISGANPPKSVLLGIIRLRGVDRRDVTVSAYVLLHHLPLGVLLRLTK